MSPSEGPGPTLTPQTAFDVLEATWPPATKQQVSGWTIREGQGGGKRVSAASRLEVTATIEAAEAAMRDIGQPPLFMLKRGADGDGQALTTRGYACCDNTLIRAAALSTMDTSADPKRLVIESEARLAVMEQIWAAGGIGPARLAVMDRVQGPHSVLLARNGDSPAATAFVACHANTAMLHALEVLPAHRRRGMGAILTRAAAHWAARQGATHLALAVTEANGPANALYEQLGLTVLTGYEYWQHSD